MNSLKSYWKLALLTLTVFSLLTSCGKDDGSDDPASVIGTWSYEEIEVTSLTIEGQDIYEYLTTKNGMSREEAEQFVSRLFATSMAQTNLEGFTVVFKSDNSYSSTQPDSEGETTGTWSISDDQKTFTSDDQTYNVITLTSSTMILEYSDEEIRDEIKVASVVEITLNKL